MICPLFKNKKYLAKPFKEGIAYYCEKNKIFIIEEYIEDK